MYSGLFSFIKYAILLYMSISDMTEDTLFGTLVYEQPVQGIVFNSTLIRNITRNLHLRFVSTNSDKKMGGKFESVNFKAIRLGGI